MTPDLPSWKGTAQTTPARLAPGLVEGPRSTYGGQGLVYFLGNTEEAGAPLAAARKAQRRGSGAASVFCPIVPPWEPD